MSVYGAETFIALLDVPGISSHGSEESDFSRLLAEAETSEAEAAEAYKVLIQENKVSYIICLVF